MIVIDKAQFLQSVRRKLFSIKSGDHDDSVAVQKVRSEMLNLTKRVIEESISESLAESEWLFASPDTDTMVCAECDYNIPSSELATPHCPWCGRYMVGWDEICELQDDPEEEDADE